MSFLVINCGTSSVKMTLFENKRGVKRQEIELDSASYSQVIEQGIEKLQVSDIKAIGHRVVHGGEKYTKSVLLSTEVGKELHALCELAPLHNPPAMEGIDCCKRLFPHIPQIAVFDTAFHATLPPQAALYPLPWDLSRKYHIKRYGFHGIAHAFSWKKYSERCGSDKKVITLHLGSGCSLTAIDKGISVDTSMGFTPLDGVMMATRCGEMDPAIVSYLCEKERSTPDQILSLLNHKSGLLGICGKKAMQEILESQDPQAKLAIEMFVYRIVKKVGAYLAVLGDVDALIFSGGIGEHAHRIREEIVRAFPSFSIDVKKSESLAIEPGEIAKIHKLFSKKGLYVVGSDENQLIAEEMKKVLEKVDGKDACSASFEGKGSP